MNNSLLIELRTEELPPKSLKALSEAFAHAVFTALREQAFALSLIHISEPTRPY